MFILLQTLLHLHLPARPCFIWWIFYRPVGTSLLLSHPIPRLSVPITSREGSIITLGQEHLMRPQQSQENTAVCTHLSYRYIVLKAQHLSQSQWLCWPEHCNSILEWTWARSITSHNLSIYLSVWFCHSAAFVHKALNNSGAIVFLLCTSASPHFTDKQCEFLSIMFI